MFNQMFDAHRRFQLALLAKANVIGVGIGYRDFKGEATGELALITMVEEKKPIDALAPEDLVPRDMEGARTDVVEVGVLRAQNFGPRDRWRPVIPGGVSVGHPGVTAGTLGALVRDASTGEPLILSNNHVLANSNSASPGDGILQPAATDQGRQPNDIVASLVRFSPLRWTDEVGASPSPPGTNPAPSPGSDGCASLIGNLGTLLTRLNRNQPGTAAPAPTASSLIDPIAAQAAIPDNIVDAALARPGNPAMFSDEIRHIGRITGTNNTTLGLRVRKAGRTTDYTEGMVTVINATVDVAYNTFSGTRTARFVNQVMCTGMSQGGDSGSLIVEVGAQNAIGLLFAGSGVVTIFTPINVVLQAMNIRF